MFGVVMGFAVSGVFNWIRMAALIAGVAWAVPGAAQMPQALSAGVQAAPRLDFTPDEMALALAVSGHPQLAAFYGDNGLRRVFSGPDGAGRAVALRNAVAAMSDHGLPLSRYRLDALTAADMDSVQGEVLHARILSRVISDLTGGMVRPSAADAHIHREVPRRAVAKDMRDFVTSADPAGFLTGLGPRDPRYRILQDALAQRARLIAPAGTPAAP
ncbi:MAG: peptidoglycan-binding protein, partial [Paracoccus sp. (in: a-proteobacteria)]|nr:peptidoglycan-binding protein [Paracoccus sp. (in: a-proteobacteria)]